MQILADFGILGSSFIHPWSGPNLAC